MKGLSHTNLVSPYSYSNVQLFAKMVADRQPAVESLQNTGQEILKTADGESKADIEVGLADIGSQWTQLNEMLDTRKKELDAAMAAAQRFYDLYKEVTKDIENTDARLKAEEFELKAKPDEIAEQVDQLKVRCFCCAASEAAVHFSYTEKIAIRLTASVRN